MVLSGRTKSKRANLELKRFVASQLEEFGYEFIPSNRFHASSILDKPIYTTHYHVGNSIYEKPLYVDLILYHPIKYPKELAIQCKWQSSSGSVEEKYPFDVLNIAYNQVDTIIILDGGGYSDRSREWLISQSGTNNFKHVFTQKEFVRFANKSL